KATAAPAAATAALPPAARGGEVGDEGERVAGVEGDVADPGSDPRHGPRRELVEPIETGLAVGQGGADQRSDLLGLVNEAPPPQPAELRQSAAEEKLGVVEAVDAVINGLRRVAVHSAAASQPSDLRRRLPRLDDRHRHRHSRPPVRAPRRAAGERRHRSAADRTVESERADLADVRRVGEGGEEDEEDDGQIDRFDRHDCCDRARRGGGFYSGAVSLFHAGFVLLLKDRKRPFQRPVVVKKAPGVDQVTGEKIPKSFVFARGKLPGPLKQLKLDLRKLMLPHTALKLKEKKRNNLKDFLNVAGPMGVTHFMILAKTSSSPSLRVARTPQGPTVSFKVRDYSLASDIARSQARPRCPPDLFKNPPLIVLSGFGSGEQHLKLATIMFQNIFPAIDINTVNLAECKRIVLLNYDKETNLIDFRHYSIRLQPVGVTRRIRKFVQSHHVPDLRNLEDVSEFITKAGYGSESEGDEEAATVSLSHDLGRVNRASNRSAIKLQEIGPRMTLELAKVEEGLCSGSVIYSSSERETAEEQEDEEEQE
ncbi:PETER PAN-like protein, partial [Wolffia australiana]